MSARRFTVTTSIPYVNGDPHLGFALECVQADVLARHRRLRGDEVRLGSGTDDNALKNVEAARAAGLPVERFVAAKARPVRGPARHARALVRRLPPHELGSAPPARA